MRLSLLSSCLAFVTFTTTAAAVVACSGTGTSINATGPASSADGGDPANPLDGAIASDAPSAGDTGGPVTPGVKPIDPIDLGWSWTYDVTITGTYPLCKAGSHVGQVLGQKVVAGKSAFQVQSFCPGAGTSSYAVTGDRVEIYYANTWVLSLDAPVAQGHMWTDGVNSYAWEKVGQVTVPDGTYDDCWNARPSVGTSYTTFCRGVGPVRWHFVDGSGNGYDATLTAHTM